MGGAKSQEPEPAFGIKHPRSGISTESRGLLLQMEKDLGHVRESMIRIRREKEGEKKKWQIGSRSCSGINLAGTKITITAACTVNLQGRLQQLNLQILPHKTSNFGSISYDFKGKKWYFEK